MSRTALITGILGQDGSYLAEHLLSMDYRVVGVVRNRDQAIPDWALPLIGRVEFVYGDLRDATSLELAIQKSFPDEVYNLAAQVFVPYSWVHPAETFDMNIGGLARILEILIRIKPDARLYQASSSEMFGNNGTDGDEDTEFIPESPYGVSKLAAHKLVGVYRKKGLYAVGGILYNHESERRGPEMVTKKIAMAVGRWAAGKRDTLELGNLDSCRDWGYAKDYVVGMVKMLQQETPKDYVIGTGETHSVRDCLASALQAAELSGPEWTVGGLLQIGLLKIRPSLQRKNEVYTLKAKPLRAKIELGWQSETSFDELMALMVHHEIAKHAVAEAVGR